MKIIVLGGGVVGITTAWFLRQDGHDVTVVDRQSAAALECSFANGGQLSYSHAEPWASPTSLKNAIRWLGKKDAPLRLPLRPDPEMWQWVFKFIRECNASSVKKNTETLIKLGLYSRFVLENFQQTYNLQFYQQQRGILHIFRDPKSLSGALKQADFQADMKVPYEKMSAKNCIDHEPALESLRAKLIGGIYYPLDETGDMHLFVMALEQLCRQHGVNFRYDMTLTSLVHENGEVVAARMGSGEDLEADAYVMALGAYSKFFLQELDIDLPIYPMKGYSITVPLGGDNEGGEGVSGGDIESANAPLVSITDQSEKTVYSRLGNILRVAGTAEFAGYNHQIDPYRIALLRLAVKRNFPHCIGIDKSKPWACLRPSTPDGLPVLGKSPIKNLFLNCGHGTLGWTQAMGSAVILSDIINSRKPKINLSGMSFSRFQKAK